MLEFLIKPIDDDWFNLHQSKLRTTLCPTSIPFAIIEGWGDQRILVSNCEISFSMEDPGIQVAFEGKITSALAQKIVEEVAVNVSSATQQEARVLQISFDA